MIGKVPPDVLREQILEKTGTKDDDVLLGPTYGEDTAAIDLGDRILVINADPLSLAAEHVGTLGVHVACNDVAASGARPRWLTNTMFLHDDDPAILDTITTQMDRAATSLGVAIVGGHAEYHDGLERPLLSLTALGVTDRYVSSGGGKPGHAVVITGTAGIEGTAILASDFARDLHAAGIEAATIDRAKTFIDRISVVNAGVRLGEQASGMHDPTEGGVLAGLVEMANATGCRFEIDPMAIPVAPETRELCDVMEVDPLVIFGSGALLATIDPDALENIRPVLADSGIDVTRIGTVTDGATGVQLGDEWATEAPSDDLYDLWA